jgi:hypothetical protein
MLQKSMAVEPTSQPERNAADRGAVLGLILATTSIRVVLAANLGLGIDESYTVATGRDPQLSTFDHPPLAWWLSSMAARGIGSESALAVRLPFIGLFAVTTWLMYSLTSRLYDSRAGLWAAVTLNLIPVLAWTSGTWVLPDGPLNAALLAGAIGVAAALFGQPSRAPIWWLAAGVAGGLALLSKLHGLFLFAGVGLFLVTSPRHRRWLVSPWPYAGFALAIVVFLPVLVWNAQHQWVSFAFQAGRAQTRDLQIWGPVVALAGQAAVLLPWLWLPLMICLAHAARSGPTKDRDWLLVCLAAGPIVVFTAVGLTGSRVLPHWAAPGYLMLVPLLGRAVAETIDAGSRLARGWLIASAASVAILLAAVVALTQLPWPQIVLADGRELRNPLEESLEWRDLARELSARGLLGRTDLFVAATRWHEAGKIDLVLRGDTPVLCLCRDPRGYGVVKRQLDYISQDALIISRGRSSAQIKTLYADYFERIDELEPVSIRHAGQLAFVLQVHMARSLRLPAGRRNLIDPLELWAASPVR